MELAEFVVRGALLGVTYGLIACPIALVYVTSGTVDLAIGAYVVLAAAVSFAAPGSVGMLLAICVAMVAASVVGVLSSLLTRRYQGDKLIVILASFGFAMMVESFVLTFFGKDPFVRQSGAAPVEFLGMPIARQSVISATIGLVLAASVYVLLHRTMLGREMRASADNARGAAIAGIPVRRVQLATFILAGALAGIAGVMTLHGAGLIFSSAVPLTITSLGGAIMFGLNRPLHAFAGGVVIGIVESLSAGFAPSQLSTLLPFAFIFAVLAFKAMHGTEMAGGRA
ncbi:MAG: branched-chain amino acid ABC transporter permease [Hyphomicrobiaceae bacterium]|nr:MAG: branched-chain amino acid ABC transporter permease [Hyphomicrobiaceae bacterium]